MAKRTRNLLLGAMILAGATYGGLWVADMNAHPAPETEAQQEEGAPSPLNDISYRPSSEYEKSEQLRDQEIRTSFEGIINNFLNELEKKAKSYREKRTTIREVTKPESMRQFDYVQENKALVGTLGSQMEADMAAIVSLFEIVDKDMKNFLTELEPDKKDSLTAEWEDMKTEKLKAYIDFFAGEKRMLQHYNAITTAYEKSGGQYAIDPASGKPKFTDPALQQAYDNAAAQLAQLSAQQKTEPSNRR